MGPPSKKKLAPPSKKKETNKRGGGPGRGHKRAHKIPRGPGRPVGTKKVVKEIAEDQKLKTLCGKANCNILFVLNKEKRSNVSVNPIAGAHK